MIPIDFTNKTALVTGVGDNVGFAWHIAKALNAAGARIVLACHPRLVNIVESILEREQDAESRQLPFGRGEFKAARVLPCDVSFDTMDDVDEKTRADKRYAKYADYSVKGTVDAVGQEFGGIDIVLHSVAFSPEIKNAMVNTSRAAYLTALSISAYSLTSLLRHARPYMAGRNASAVGLSYIGGDRVVPHYGGGMSTAKAALQLDAQQLASNLGPDGIRVNVVSAGPYASRAARAIGDIDDMIDYAAKRSPLQRAITPEEVGNAVVYLCSDLASGVTGQILYVDAGYHVMGV